MLAFGRCMNGESLDEVSEPEFKIKNPVLDQENRVQKIRSESRLSVAIRIDAWFRNDWQRRVFRNRAGNGSRSGHDIPVLTSVNRGLGTDSRQIGFDRGNSFANGSDDG
jgi:hypothetical protein